MKRLLAVFLAAVFLCGCTGSDTLVSETYFAMDTIMDLKVWGKDAQEGLDQIKTLLRATEEDWSAADEASRLSKINRGEVTLSPEEAQLLARTEELMVRTGGAFDPKMRAVSQAWGFFDQAYRIPSADELAAALEEEQWDLGAAMKGYAGQEAADLLEELDVDRAILTLGGNVQTYGQKPDGSPWQVAIQNPDGGDYLGVISVMGTASVVTSGDYQRYFEEDGVKYHHIIDPETGRPADSGLSSVTIICRDGLTADALSTALFVMGLENAVEFWRESEDFEAVFILSTGEIYATEGAALSGCTYEVILREE